MSTTAPKYVLPPPGSLTAEELRALPEGSLVVTYGVGHAKTGPDEWRCPFTMHVRTDPRLGEIAERYPWADIRDSEWLAKVATMVVFDPSKWEGL